MPESSKFKPHGRAVIHASIAVTALLSIGAIVVRGIAPANVASPKDVVDDKPRIAEPMQFLSRGAPLRAAELDNWIANDRRASFKAQRELIFHLEKCPPLMEWIDGVEGLRFERLLSDLRNGSREEALASLALTFELARATKWKPGLLGHSEHAERLGGLLQDWLRVWAERSAKDSLLSDPALAAALVYGKVMRSAWRAPVVGYNQAPFDRAQTFLSELLGAASGRRTAFGEALQSQHARATARLLADKDALAGLDADASILFPDLRGECDE